MVKFFQVVSNRSTFLVRQGLISSRKIPGCEGIAVTCRIPLYKEAQEVTTWRKRRYALPAAVR